MNKIYSVVWLVFSALFLSAPGIAQQQVSPEDSSAESEPRLTGMQWVLRMSESIQQLNYQVSLVEHRPNADTIPYIWRHGVFGEGVEMEQLNILNGPGKEFIRINDVVSVFQPHVSPYSISAQRIETPIPSQLLNTPVELQAAYEFIAVGRGRVSGHIAHQIRVISRDNTRYSYQLWLDEQTAMPLKLNMLDFNGKVMKQIQVTQFLVTETPDPFFSRINRDMLPDVASTLPTAHQHTWEVEYLPQGMRVVRRNTHRLSVTGQIVEYALLSDGLVDISVYVMPSAKAILDNNIYRHEAKTVLILTRGNAQISIIGEIPAATANKIATSIGLRE